MAFMCVLTVAKFRQQNYLAKFWGQTHSITSAYQHDDRNCNSTDTDDKNEANFSHRENKTNSFLAPTHSASLCPPQNAVHNGKVSTLGSLKDIFSFICRHVSDNRLAILIPVFFVLSMCFLSSGSEMTLRHLSRLLLWF